METIKNRFKAWVLSWDFVRQKMYTEVFKNATDDVLEIFEGDVEDRAKELAIENLNKLLSPVDLTRIVTIDKNHGILYVGGVKADAGRLNNLKAEAEAFAASDLWQLLYETPKELAQRQMFVSSESLDDLVKGKSILYTLATQKNIVETLKTYTQRPPLKPTGGV